MYLLLFIVWLLLSLVASSCDGIARNNRFYGLVRICRAVRIAPLVGFVGYLMVLYVVAL